jgi:thiosulfate reductase cytochrome b subunit
MISLYLYPGWVRAWHWLNALLFLVLMVTGASMHFSGISWLLPFPVARLVHNVAGILITLAWIGFVAGNLLTDNGRHYRVRLRGFLDRLIAQSRYYAVGIFRNEPHPFHPSVEEKFNTLQQLSYLGVMYLMMPILIGSGLAFLFSVWLPETLFGIGAVWVVAMVHLTVAWLLSLFLFVHLYVITTGETPWTNLVAMLTGWHRERHPG